MYYIEQDSDNPRLNLFYLGLFTIVFIAIVFFHPSLFDNARWDGGLDLDRDGRITISDIFSWLLWIFSMPGDVVIQCAMPFSWIADFFELSPDSFGMPGSVAMSLVYWWLLGGKRMVLFWAGVIALVIYRFLPGVPLPS